MAKPAQDDTDLKFPNRPRVARAIEIARRRGWKLSKRATQKWEIDKGKGATPRFETGGFYDMENEILLSLPLPKDLPLLEVRAVSPDPDEEGGIDPDEFYDGDGEEE